MKRPCLHTAIWKGTEHTLSMRGWQEKVYRSGTFLRKHIDIAESKGIAYGERMQFAIAQKSDYGKCGSVKRKTPQLKQSIRVRLSDVATRNTQAMLRSMARLAQ